MSNDSEGKEGEGKEELFCYCKQPYNEKSKKWMIQCEKCENWFHGECICIEGYIFSKDEDIQAFEKFFCDDCLRRDSSLQIVYTKYGHDLRKKHLSTLNIINPTRKRKRVENGNEKRKRSKLEDEEEAEAVIDEEEEIIDDDEDEEEKKKEKIPKRKTRSSDKKDLAKLNIPNNQQVNNNSAQEGKVEQLPSQSTPHTPINRQISAKKELPKRESTRNKKKREEKIKEDGNVKEDQTDLKIPNSKENPPFETSLNSLFLQHMNNSNNSNSSNNNNVENNNEVIRDTSPIIPIQKEIPKIEIRKDPTKQPIIRCYCNKERFINDQKNDIIQCKKCKYYTHSICAGIDVGSVLAKQKKVSDMEFFCRKCFQNSKENASKVISETITHYDSDNSIMNSTDFSELGKKIKIEN